MKARKIETDQNLMQDVIKHVHLFRPEVGMIKNRIEALIEKEYIMRDENDRHKYIYLP